MCLNLKFFILATFGVKQGQDLIPIFNNPVFLKSWYGVR